jgi:hypothetical protein
MDHDKELSAIQSMISTLQGLDDAERRRAYAFVGEKLGLQVARANSPVGPGTTGDQQRWRDFAELFAAIQPTMDKERALVACYWRQVCQGDENFGSQAINADLKDLGHGVGNITDALAQLMDERPQLVLQVRKAGATKQARKTYRLSTSGKQRVEEMLSRNMDMEV